MRIGLAGNITRSLQAVVIKFTANTNFLKQPYLDLGYNFFDVICIGAGGGTGGGIDTANTGTNIINFGGAGGGGGFHRVRGLLSALPTSAPVVVGVGGAPGLKHASLPANTTNGGDGGYSSFNNPTCRASGGRGGKRSQSNSVTAKTLADGGEGGIGDRTTVGGGGLGGIAGTPVNATATIQAANDGTPGSDGPLLGNIGKGGGGGAGGVGRYGTNYWWLLLATAGGKGSWNPGDISVYGPAGTTIWLPGGDPKANTIPGYAGGAKATPLNGLPDVFGNSHGELVAGDPGVVILRLTAE